MDSGLKYMEYMLPRTTNSFYLEHVTSEDIMLEIKWMKPNKSPSHDLIGVKLLNYVLEDLPIIWLRFMIGA